jgi:hypothetical protein
LDEFGRTVPIDSPVQLVYAFGDSGGVHADSAHRGGNHPRLWCTVLERCASSGRRCDDTCEFGSSHVMSGTAENMELLSPKVGHLPRVSRKILSSGKGEQSSGPLVITSIRGTSKPCTAVQPSAQAASTSSGRSNTKADPSAHAQRAPATKSQPQACGIAAVGPSPSKSVVNLTFPR